MNIKLSHNQLNFLPFCSFSARLVTDVTVFALPFDLLAEAADGVEDPAAADGWLWLVEGSSTVFGTVSIGVCDAPV